MSRVEQETVRSLTELVTPVVESEGMELVDLQYRRERNGWVVRLFVDKPGGINLDDCGSVSAQIGHLLDVENIIPHSYTLEVSSPGVTRPLKKLEDFIRFKGRAAVLRLDGPVLGRKTWRGKILEVRGGIIELSPKDPGEKVEIPFERIEKAHLEFEWN
jgi:ribosome maturation factor RimP